MRHIILHYHILKNAGTTVRSILEKNFKQACGDVEGPNPWDTIDARRVLEFARGAPGLQAISTHQARLPAPEDAEITFHPVIFLRHPIDRAGSVYSFERREPADSPGLGARVARERDLAEYIRWRLTDGNGAVVRNFQTVHLAGRERDMRTAMATEADLELALDRLRQLPFFGIVELFDESVAAMRDFLAGVFGKLDVSYAMQNVTPGRRDGLQDRLDEIKQRIGSELFDELVQKNALDLELYAAAVKLFRTR